MKKSTLITIAVIIVLAIGVTILLKTKVFAKEEKNECFEWCTLTKEEVMKKASEEFGKKFDKIQDEKEKAKKKADEEAEMKMWRALENISTSTGTISTGFTN
jgi:hypothetical protein